MFTNCESLTYLDLSSFKTDHLVSMAGMFCFCNNLLDVNLSTFNTENGFRLQNWPRMALAGPGLGHGLAVLRPTARKL